MLAFATFLVAACLAIAMGASGMAPSFGAAVGSTVVSRRLALILYTGCVVAGAALLGERVARTVGGGIAPSEAFTPAMTLGVLAAVALAMVGANLLRIPQSTSWVTVASVVVVGLAYGRVDLDLVAGRLLPAWVLLPVASYGICRVAIGRLHPLRAGNMRLHERLRRRRRLVRGLVILSGCYVAFAIGANNVANVVGPMMAGGMVAEGWGSLLAAPLFGLGAVLIAGPSETVGRGIVPLGDVSAAIVGLVVGTLLLVASLLSIPQSLVQLHMGAVLAISHAKEGSVARMPTRELRRIAVVWLGAPAIAAALTWVAVGVVR